MARKRKARAGAAAALAARGYRYARQINWPVVWMRAKWLTHHGRRLYNNLAEDERKELLRLVVPTKNARMVAKEDRARVVELVTKAWTGR